MCGATATSADRAVGAACHAVSCGTLRHTCGLVGTVAVSLALRAGREIILNYAAPSYIG